ncbi:PalH/RIM21-domain-containing protein [Morchella snyderi]|nr:PalH/RIM21-domain-containing protein [Morchella snyderi]
MPRQNWRAPTSTTIRPTTTSYVIPESCSPFTMSSGYTISLSPESTLTLSNSAVATPECWTSTPTPTGTASAMPELDGGASSEDLAASDLRDPFYASTIPMAYSISATTTLAYVLLFLLFLPNPPNSRPWLQKVATLTVVVCLTIAFAETTTVLEEEYKLVGSSLYSLTNEAREVRRRVVGGTVIRIGRIISDLFLWLAQVQTLIRLFPREREKVIIKWAGFCLILLDTIFSILQTFVSPLATDPDSFLDAIPALSYLFQIALSLLYASCVMYYSFAKRKYSYLYPHSFFKPAPPGSKQYGGRSIVLVAILSIASVLTPIVFFVLDIAQKDLAGWGDYIRWVGAASASAVVWEWVDRIEGLEREECKGGVLGREVFDEDEDEDDGFTNATRRRRTRRRSGDDEGGGGGGGGGANGIPLSRATTVTSASTSYAVNVRRVDTADTGVGGGLGRGRGTPGTVRSASTVSGRRVTPAISEEVAASAAADASSPPLPLLALLRRPETASPEETPAPVVEDREDGWEDHRRSPSPPFTAAITTHNNLHPPAPPAPSQSTETLWPWRKWRQEPSTSPAMPAPSAVSLPVTIIPAPPRGAQGSWGAVERARAMAEAEAERDGGSRVELPPSSRGNETVVRDWGDR